MSARSVPREFPMSKEGSAISGSEHFRIAEDLALACSMPSGGKRILREYASPDVMRLAQVHATLAIADRLESVQTMMCNLYDAILAVPQLAAAANATAARARGPGRPGELDGSCTAAWPAENDDETELVCHYDAGHDGSHYDAIQDREWYLDGRGVAHVARVAGEEKR